MKLCLREYTFPVLVEVKLFHSLSDGRSHNVGVHMAEFLHFCIVAWGGFQYLCVPQLMFLVFGGAACLVFVCGVEFCPAVMLCRNVQNLGGESCTVL